jgi:F0F1-type ATP synthase delta subunit
MEKLYAKAIDDLIHHQAGDAKKVVAALVAQLKTSGRTKLLPGIVRELKVLEARREKSALTLEVASEKESAAALAAAHAAGIEVTKAHVNHALIKGWRVRGGGLLIDKSAKRSLIDLYRKVTS